jgi:hypothetical protein
MSPIGAPEGHRQIAVDGVDRDPATHRLLGIDVEAPVIEGPAQIVVDIAGALGLLEDLGKVARELTPQLGRGPVDLRDDRLQHRRTRRHLHDGDRGARALDHLAEQLARLDRDLVTGAIPIVLVGQLHLKLAVPGIGAQIVMTHHAVEVEGAGGPGIELNGGDLGHAAQLVGHAMRQVRRHRQRRPSGMSSTTENSGLLSSGSILTATRLK